MKNLPLLLSTLFLTIFLSACYSSKDTSFNNLVAVLQVDEPIPGVCDNSQVISILPFLGNHQIKAVASMTDDEIEKELNEKVEFLKSHPEIEEKGIVGLIVNCKGDMVQCKIDNKTQYPELDEQIVAVFNQLKKWKAGTLNGKAVDTSVLYGFSIKDGKITL